MITGSGKLVEFKPARRVFAGRGRSMLTFAEWRLMLGGIVLGAALAAGWLSAPLEPGEFPALAQPSVLAQPAPQPGAAAPAEPATAAPPQQILPQVVVANGTRDRAPPPAPPTDYQGRVARIVDGDTFYLEGVETRVRLWGVDAPERDEEGFDEASLALAALVEGQSLACEHVDTDRYARIVARCRLADGRDLSAAMIDSGTAREYLRFTHGYYSAARRP